jgi:hypothetical protein
MDPAAFPLSLPEHRIRITEIGRFVFVHFLGHRDVIVAADAASLIFTKEEWPMVFA